MKPTYYMTRKGIYKRPDDIREVLPPEYVHRFLAIDYRPNYLNWLFESSVRRAEYAHKADKYLDYYRMKLIADIEDTERRIKEYNE